MVILTPLTTLTVSVMVEANLGYGRKLQDLFRSKKVLVVSGISGTTLGFFCTFSQR